MNEPQQLALIGSQEAKRAIEYIAPSPELVRKYAQIVCGHLEQQRNTKFSPNERTEFITDFANFIGALARLQVAYLNQGEKYVTKES